MRSVQEHAEIFSSYFPSGRAFAIKDVVGSVLNQLLRGISGEAIRVDEAIETLRQEVIPDQTVAFLAEWESALGIPDDCFDGLGDVTERRRDVILKLSSLGLQTRKDFEDWAADLGVQVEVLPGSLHGAAPFEFPILFYATGKEARNTIVVNFVSAVNASFPYTFAIAFAFKEVAIITCIFEKLKPASTQVQFVQF